ncbi:MAG: VacJ family lipoprotein [Opitutaceae bacterium]|nr:VacJ family lipoprotein [Opitutaceae bacterium]
MKTIELYRQIQDFRFLSFNLPIRKALAFSRIVLASYLILASLISPVNAATSHDPLEKVNRVTYGFNRIVDGLLFKPAAKAYGKITPVLVKKGVRNFFYNLDDVRVIFNELMQLKIVAAASDMRRLAVNSTFGIGGIIDVAGPVLKLEKHNEDFGQTLAFWNVGAGPYLVLPFFGPSTLRDSSSLFVDSLVHPIPQTDHIDTRNTLLTGNVIDSREAILGFDGLVSGDDYLFVRVWYLQYREYLNNDGNLEISFVDF